MRNTKRIVYGSSYDRGLEHLLKMWPDIKKEAPQVELHVFYGWNLFDVMAKGNPQMQDWKDRMNKLMTQDGITQLGRISHEAVKVEYENAGIWAYPTHFGEISCISAMKAQAYGAIPVVIDYAALKETVQYGIKIDGDIYEPEIKEKFKSELIALLKDEKRQEEIRVPMMEWARNKFAWSNVAKQWTESFNEPVSLEKQVNELMDDNQALKAWELVKGMNSPIKDRVWLKVKHAFDKDAYKEYYEKHLVENPVPEDLAYNCTRLFPRFEWVVPRILETKPSSALDLGCADGYLVLTLCSRDSNIKATGVNLYQPSIELARNRAEKNNLKNARFVKDDVLEFKGMPKGTKYDAVTMMEILEHLPDPQKGVDVAMKLLTPGGTAFFTAPRVDHIGVEQHKKEQGRKSWDDGMPSGHLRLFTEEEFKALFGKYVVTDFTVDAERCMCIAVKNV